jgi:hypothetical protein
MWQPRCAEPAAGSPNGLESKKLAEFVGKPWPLYFSNLAISADCPASYACTCSKVPVLLGLFAVGFLLSLAWSNVTNNGPSEKRTLIVDGSIDIPPNTTT